MDSVSALLVISGAIAVGAMSPGPSFVVVARTALNQGKRAGILTALGMGLAGALFAALAVAGVAAALNSAAWLLATLKVLGGLFLAYLGVSMIRHSRASLSESHKSGRTSRQLVNGFVVQVSNPKTIVVYASVFSALLPQQTESWLAFTLPVVTGLIELVWYIVVAVVFSNRKAEQTYLKRKIVVDRVAGAVMLALAFRMLTTI